MQRHPSFVALAALADDALAQRCRAHGLSRDGGRETKIARLVHLYRFLDGEVDRRDAAAIAAAKEELERERLQMEIDRVASAVLDPGPGTDGGASPDRAEKATAAPPPVTVTARSRWDRADSEDG